MKEIILFSLLITANIHGMENVQEQTNTNPFSQRTIFEWLNLHPCGNYTAAIDPCDQVEKIVTQNPNIVHTKEINMASAYRNKTPLEMAITVAKCQTCENVLKEHGAKETDYIKYWLEKYSHK